MSASKKASIVHNRRPQAKLTMRRRFLPLAPLLPLARLFITVALIAAGGYAAWNYFLNTPGANALQFTAHMIGASGSALGVLDVQVGDMNGDKIPDVVIGGTKGIVVYTQDKKHNFTRTVVDGASTIRIQLADLDKDGAMDIVASLKNGPGAKWYRNNSDGSFTGHNLGSASGAGVAAAGDIDGDGNKDIVTAVESGGIIALQRWMGDGAGNFSGPTTLSADSGVTAIAIGDINGNGFNDIVTGGANGLQHWDTHDGTSWSRADIDSDHTNGSDIALADINGDGKVDILTVDQNKNQTAYYRNTDNSNAFNRIELDGDADGTTILAADLNNDGVMDVVTAAQDDNSVYFYQNDGSDSFTRSTLVTSLQSVFGVAVADISGDKNLDIVAGDLFRGNLFWYQRVLALPVASAPNNIKQSTGGHGILTFDTNISSADFNATRLKVEYSTDGGATWNRPALTDVTATVGSTDLNTNATYQVGSSNPIDTDETDSIKVTLTWDTRATTNDGGPLVGNQARVMIRVTPRDNILVGDPSTSAAFLVDNQGPTNVSGFQVLGTSKDQIQLAWQKPTDKSDWSYSVSYGTDEAAVASKKASLWNDANDKALSDQATTGTIITGLTDNTTYNFKLFVTDAFGNVTASPVISGTTNDSGVLPSLAPTSTAAPSSSPGASETVLPVGSVIPTSTPSATPAPANFQNHPPVADAGQDQLVNPNALVILDGTASSDPDGDALTYSWRQLSGPQTQLLSNRTATPSFSAGGENQSYIFALTVRDPKGASSTDVVTVATRVLPPGNTIAVTTDKNKPVVQPVKQLPTYEVILQPINYLLFVLALLLTAVSMVDRFIRQQNTGSSPAAASATTDDSPRGKVVNSKTGQPIVGAQVLVYGTDGKLRTQLKTSSKGEFETLFPPGQYTIAVQVEGFTFAPLATGAAVPASTKGMVYSGGTLTITDGTKPVAMTIPMKPTAADVSEWRTRLLHGWQAVQRISRIFSWPVFLVGALLNTVLIFLDPGIAYLVIEVLYVGLVILKVSLEVRVRPAYGLVRDAITHVPLDLAVVRLYDEKTNRLIMTRVANAQGKFFALPSAGTYAISVTKPGYATFTKQHLTITGEQDSVLQITSDLMPVTPQGGLNVARAAVL